MRLITKNTTLAEFNDLVARSKHRDSIKISTQYNHLLLGLCVQHITIKREQQSAFLAFVWEVGVGANSESDALAESNSDEAILSANEILGLVDRPNVLSKSSNLEHLKYVLSLYPKVGYSVEFSQTEAFSTSYIRRVKFTSGEKSYSLIFYCTGGYGDDDQCYYLAYTTQEDIEAVNSILVNQSNLSIQTEGKAPLTNWDVRKLKYVLGEINTWSKDPSTKVSAAIFKGKYPICSSYNGFPPGVEDTEERLNNRPLKYKLVQHAEANCITTCARLGIQTEGMTMAISLYPCTTCAGMIIGAGIKEIITQEPTEDAKSRWKEDFDLAAQMFEEAGVKVTMVKVD